MTKLRICDRCNKPIGPGAEYFKITQVLPRTPNRKLTYKNYADYCTACIKDLANSDDLLNYKKGGV